MGRLTAAQEEIVRETYQETRSIRATSRKSGHTFSTVARVVGDVAAPALPVIDYDRLAATIAAQFGLVVPGQVNEGPLIPQGQAPTPAGIRRAPRFYERTVWLSDLHHPYQDQPAVDAALDLCRDWKPSLIILGGDLFDSYLISSYEKEPERLGHHLQQEFDAAKPFVKAVDSLGCDVVFILGNHEARIDALIAKNPGLAKLRALRWHNMAELPERWEILPQHSRYRIGGLDFHHGDLKSGPGGRYVAARMLEDLKRSNIFGHFHRDQFYPEPDGDGVVRGGFASGHLCNTEEAGKYCKINRWTTGFRSVDMDPTTGLFEVRSHLIHAGRFRFNGRTYGG